MEAQETKPYLQKTYDCVFRHGGNLLHSMPLNGITRDELKLLVFVHGRSSIDPSSVKFAGEREMSMNIRAPDGHDREGQEITVPVRSQEDEYRRLSLKYDTFTDLDGIGRGRRYVEACFRVRLDDFGDDLLAEVDPIAEIEAAAARAELKTTASLVDDEPPAQPPSRAPSMARALAGER